LEANIRNSKNGTIGFLIVHIAGLKTEYFEEFKNELEGHNVNVEVVRHG
ncbi:methionine ABC transporter ATP-binding protein, partial [Staphylococcus aureus]